MVNIALEQSSHFENIAAAPLEEDPEDPGSSLPAYFSEWNSFYIQSMCINGQILSLTNFYFFFTRALYHFLHLRADLSAD